MLQSKLVFTTPVRWQEILILLSCSTERFIDDAAVEIIEVVPVPELTNIF